MSTINKLTAVQSLLIIEGLLKDTIASTKYAEIDIKRDFDVTSLLLLKLRQIREDSKIIYHLLDRITSISCQTTDPDNLKVPSSFASRIFNYEELLSKMGETDTPQVKAGNHSFEYPGK